MPDLNPLQQRAANLGQLATHVASECLGSNGGCVLILELTNEGNIATGWGMNRHSNPHRDAIVLARAIAFIEREAQGAAAECPNSPLWMKTFECELIRARAMPNRSFDVMQKPPKPHVPQGDSDAVERDDV